MYRRTLLVVSVLLVACFSSAGIPQRSSTTSLQLQPCDVPGIKVKTKCGILEVFENRAARKGRKINLKIIVVPATGTSRSEDPVFYIGGGPGSSATEESPGSVPLFASILEHRDLVFVDQRGTGGSNPLNCSFYDTNDPQSFLEYFFPLNDVKKCRKELESKADLTLYTTSIAMDDLDEVRSALGYDQINIFAGSYGTRAALVYLRQHPEHLRTLTLQGVVPTNDYMPFDFARRNERALQGVIAECVGDAACNKAFPNLREETKAALSRLLQGPIDVEIMLPETNPPTTTKVKLSRNLGAEAIRYLLYSPAGAARVPLILHQAGTGNFAPLAQAAFRFRQGIVSSGSNGMYLSVTCAEDLPWIKRGEGERLAQNTFLGDYRITQQRGACALWPRAKLSSDFGKPVKSSAAVLILTGEWDPVTPPSNGDSAARSLPNSRHIIVPHGGHGFGGLDGLACIQTLLTNFLEQGTAKNLDTSCVANVKRRGFVLK
jgi:pimeloyl-ACP methyl ester carboxylesterase